MNLRLMLLFPCVLVLPELVVAENIIRVTAPIAHIVSPPIVEEPPEQEMRTGSCAEILQSRPKSASGVYTLNLSDRSIEAYCDMTSDGGGWTMVVAQFEADPVSNWNEGIQPDYNPTLSSGRGFALSTAQIPKHTQTAFGKNLVATDFEYFDITYSTNGIRWVEYKPVGHKTGIAYKLHRHTSHYYAAHNPGPNPGQDNNWNNTLTVYGGGKATQWAFSPQHTTLMMRGYAYRGAEHENTNTFAWTVWVR